MTRSRARGLCCDESSDMSCADFETGAAEAGAAPHTKAPSAAAIIAALTIRVTLISAATVPHRGFGVNRLTVERRAPQAYAGGMTDHRQREEEQRREALATLNSLRENDTVVSSSLARAAKRTSDHFAGRDAVTADGSADSIELWGRRIGRALSLVGLIALLVYFYVTYFVR